MIGRLLLALGIAFAALAVWLARREQEAVTRLDPWTEPFGHEIG